MASLFLTHIIVNYQTKHPDWIVVRHEDLSTDPVTQFKKLYEKLGLNFDCQVEKNILNSTNGFLKRRLMRDSGKVNLEGTLPVFPPNWGWYSDWFQLGLDYGILPSTTLARSSYYLASRYPETLTYKHELWHHFQNYIQNPSGKWHYLNETLGAYRVHDQNYSKIYQKTSTSITETVWMADQTVSKFPEYASIPSGFLQFLYFKNQLYNWITPNSEPEVLLRSLIQGLFWINIWVVLMKFFNAIKLVAVWRRAYRWIK